MDKVERVARAMFSELYMTVQYDDFTGDMEYIDKEDFRNMALAAIREYERKDENG